MHCHKTKNNNIQQMLLNTFITYIKYSYMFRPLLAIFREWYTIKHQSNDSKICGQSRLGLVKVKMLLKYNQMVRSCLADTNRWGCSCVIFARYGYKDQNCGLAVICGLHKGTVASNYLNIINVHKCRAGLVAIACGFRLNPSQWIIISIRIASAGARNA
jgi:hypothetical protein